MIRRWMRSSVLIRRSSNWLKDSSSLKVRSGSTKTVVTCCSAIRMPTRFTSTHQREIRTEARRVSHTEWLFRRRHRGVWAAWIKRAHARSTRTPDDQSAWQSSRCARGKRWDTNRAGRQLQGKRLNSPNDLVYRSDGTLFFTDPPFGFPKFFNDARKQLAFSGVYSIYKGKLQLVSKDFTGPNGIALSPDEKYLYVGNWPRSLTGQELRKEDEPPAKSVTGTKRSCATKFSRTEL